jgi:MarR family transcriptional regulator, organic hydroperoxide resistance regulator
MPKVAAPPKAMRKATHPPDIGIGKLLRRAHMAFSRQFRLRLQSHDVTFGEFIHLEKLWHEDGLNQTEISRRAGVETASSTAILDRLAKRGYVTRKRNGADRRNINVFLRPDGIALKSRLLACAKAINSIARMGLNEREIVTFFALMERIVDNLEATDIAPSRTTTKASAGQRSRESKTDANSRIRASMPDQTGS